MTLAFLLFALIAGVLYFAPQSPGPFATQTILAPTTSDPSIGTTVPTLDSEVRISNTVTLGSGPSATLGPLRGTVPQRPEAAVAIVPVRTLDVPSTNTVTPSNANLWETSAAPFMPVAPTNDPIFALAENVALNVSLIVPAQASREKLRDISEALLATGFEINEPRLVTYKVTTTQVRYFHDRDAKAAAKLADDIGGTVRDFTDFNPSPPLGFVEVFIEESPSASPQKPAPRGLPGDLRQFGNDVRETLRSITR